MFAQKVTQKATQVVAALAVAGAVGLAAAPAASAAPASEWEGADPAEAQCLGGAYVVDQWSLVNERYGEVQGVAQLVYSPTCGTNWVNVHGFVTGNRYEVGLTNLSNGASYGATVVNVGSAGTLQTIAPGNTCVLVSSSIEDLATGVLEGYRSRVYC